MKSIIAILVIGYISWTYTDLSSESSLESVLSPLVFLLCLIALCLWLVLRGGFGGRTSDRSSGLGSYFDGGGGD